MPTISIISNDIKAAAVFGGMFGSAEPTNNPDEVFFKLDPNLVDVCKGMGTHLVNGIALKRHEVHTIDVPENLYAAFRANLALQMLRKWGIYYVDLGMDMAAIGKPIEQRLSIESISSLSFAARPDISSQMLEADYRVSVSAIKGFLDAMGDSIRLVNQPIRYTNIGFVSSPCYDYEQGALAGSKVRFYFERSTQVTAMPAPDDGSPVPATSFNAALTNPYSVVERVVEIPDDHCVNGYGFHPIFLPRRADELEVEGLISLLGRDELKKLTFGGSFDLIPSSITIEPFSSQEALETQRLVIGESNQSSLSEAEAIDQGDDAHEEDDDIVTIPPRFRFA